MRKFQQFIIFKFQSARLRQSNYKIDLTIEEGRRNLEVISQGENAVIRSIFKITNRCFDLQYLSNLQAEKKNLSNLSTTRGLKGKLQALENQIDNYLFISQVISVTFSDNRHYRAATRKGIYINGKKFVRLLCGSGNARKNTVLFVDEDIFDQLINILDNGRNKDIELVPAKYNAYFALTNSTGYPVSFPRILVVSDAEIRKNVLVDWVEETGTIEPQQKELDFNLFDGQGLISPDLSKKWAIELGLDWTPSSFIIRAPFLKGMVVTFDFLRFAKEVAGADMVTDIWGNQQRIEDIDIIISQSQFKLWNSYPDLSHYLQECEKNHLGFSVSRYTPKHDKTTVRSNYQFLQVLDLDDRKIEGLCQKTIKFFKYSILEDWRYALLYLLGDGIADADNPAWFDNLHDPLLKSLVLNNSILNDPYVKSHLVKSLNKKMKDAALGKLVLNGNYQIAIADPYAQCQHIFGMPITGLLNEKEYFSGFWLQRLVTTVAACRAPLTWVSEVNVLNFVNGYEVRDWYRYIRSGMIYNVHGTDSMIHADSDNDGDLVFSTNQREFIDGAMGGLPVSYAKKSAPKFLIDQCNLWESDLKGFHSRVGFITNISTSMYAMLPLFDKDTAEYQELIRRLKFSRFLQGSEIDSAKGLEKYAMPKEWVNWSKTPPEANNDEIKFIRFLNNILVEKRPYFFRFLYGTYNNRYKKFLDRFELVCQTRLGIGINDVLQKDRSDLSLLEEEILTNFNRFNPLLDTDSTMNRICHYMEDAIKEIKIGVKEVTFDHTILMNQNIPIDKNKLKRLNEIWMEWKRFKQGAGGDQEIGKKEFVRYIRLKMNKISSNASELVNLSVELLYQMNPRANKDMLWVVLGDEVSDNVKLNRQKNLNIPVLDARGNLEYLGKKFSLHRILS